MLTGAVRCCLQLSRELQDIMKEQDASLSADAVADDVYQWDILLGGFAAESPLGQARQYCSVTVAVARRSMDPRSGQLL